MRMCQWAACDREAVEHEDGWDHCAWHLMEHRALLATQPGREPDVVRPGVVLAPGVRLSWARTECVRLLHAQGMTDAQISAAIALTNSVVGRCRRALGLPPLGRTGPQELKPCGTVAAHRRHQRRGEKCARCREAYNATKRKQGYPATQKRWAS